MRDLPRRFEALDLIDAPYQWPDIERRAARPGPIRTPAWLHGAWVAAATAAAVLVFAAGVAAGRWLLGAGPVFEAAFGPSGVFRPASPADVSVLALVVAGTGGGAVLLGAALTLVWRWRRHHRRTTMQEPPMMTEARGGEMETMEKTIEKPERTIEQVTRSNRWLILAVVVLLAAVVAFGAWLLIDNLVTSDVEQVVLDSKAAMNAHDVDAFMALQTEDVVLTTVIDGVVTEYEGAARVRMWFNRLFDSFYTEATGPMVASGDYLTHPETVGWDEKPGYEGIHVYRIEDGLIAESYFIGRELPR